MDTKIVTVYFDHKPHTFIHATVAGIHDGWLYVKEFDFSVGDSTGTVRYNGFELNRVQGVYAETLYDVDPEQAEHIEPTDSDLYRSIQDRP